MDEDGFLTLNEVAEILETTTLIVRDYISHGRLPATRRGATWVVHRDDLERFSTELRVQHENLDLLTIDEVATILRSGRSLVTNLIRKGQLSSALIGARGQHRIRRSDVVRYIDEQFAGD